jgi:hypothetical protein
MLFKLIKASKTRKLKRAYYCLVKNNLFEDVYFNIFEVVFLYISQEEFSVIMVTATSQSIH